MVNKTVTIISEDTTSAYEDRCTTGVILPIIPFEITWAPWLRATLYCAGLIYCSMGVTIIAGLFMGAIEKITSKTRKVYLSRGGVGEAAADGDGKSQLRRESKAQEAEAAAHPNAPEVIHVRIWNDTVANLTLMALGSSAPEILLAVMEIVGNRFKAGELGPGTIVGSAAFNLLVITAVCILAIPDTRRIRTYSVFLVTSAFCLASYIWLLVILEYSSPNVVESWEAAVTLCGFPAMVLLAYWADKGFTLCPFMRHPVWLRKIGREGQVEIGMNGGNAPLTGGVPSLLLTPTGEVDKEGLVAFYKNLRKHSKLTDQDAAVLAATKLIESQPKSRMWYGVGAVRGLSGGKKLQPVLNSKLRTVYETVNNAPDLPNIGPVPLDSMDAFGAGRPSICNYNIPTRLSIVEFECATISVPENIGRVQINIVRYGSLENMVRVRIESFDGTAKAGSDYVHINEIMIFAPGQKQQQTSVEIIDDEQWEPDEEFFLRLTMIENESIAQLGRLSIMEVVILDDDEPGQFTFNRRGLLVKESCEYASIEVHRVDGADGEVAVHWRTLDGTAKDGVDYQSGAGRLAFRHREKVKYIEIPVIDSSTSVSKDCCFEIELYAPEGGATVGKVPKLAVTITNDDTFTSFLNRMLVLTTNNLRSMQVHQQTWAEQIQDALTVNGGNVECATSTDYLMHFITFGWKVTFATCIPPPGLFGGWLCFFSCLMGIGLLTAIVGDLASIFGCLVGLKDTVTAITFVSLGTSLPDLFASKVAATQEKYADNAIGNVTGSNSVNVFLGLGLPWLMAAIVHEWNNEQFIVPSGSLAFSVGVYSSVAMITMLLLFFRRNSSLFGNAELGGPTATKRASAGLLVGLWFLYIILSAMKAYDHI